MTTARTTRWTALGGGLVGALAFVELTSGVLQGYYTPLVTDIAHHLGVRDADVNWFEAAQLLVSALSVPVLAKLGDLWGHKRVLVVSAVIAAVATWGVAFAPGFCTYLVAWALQGVYTVWLPLEVALIHLRSQRRLSGADHAAATRKATGVVVAALEAGAILGALGSGLVSTLAGGRLWLQLSVPALLVTAVVVVVVRKVPDVHEREEGSLDGRGLGLAAVSLLLVTGGLSLVRLVGPGSPWPWIGIVAGLVMLWPFARHELSHVDPLIDLRVMRRPSMWPVQVTSLLFGVSILGAQIPLSTFARTDPDEHGYGLGLTTAQVAPVIGAYVVSLLIGAVVSAVLAARTDTRRVLVAAAMLLGVGYLMFLPLHGSLPEVALNMVVAGLGSGALVAALPAAAAAVADEGRTAVATGLTNTAKTVGGSFASCVFAVALASGAVAKHGDRAGVGSLSGYMTVWTICGATGLLAALVLVLLPKGSFR